MPFLVSEEYLKQCTNDKYYNRDTHADDTQGDCDGSDKYINDDKSQKCGAVDYDDNEAT